MDGFNNWLQILGAAFGSIFAAIAGVLMRYAHKAQRGEPVDFTRVWLDGPTIFVMGLAGYAAHEYWGLPEAVGYVAASLLGYLGPSAVQLAVDYFQRRISGDGGGGNADGGKP